ncbi:MULTISPECIES: YtzI protein [Exiguobacterium]|uniref:Tumour necrosis factor receptor superfamily member 19 n=1 Tax=Exiguobacterium sibiricum (strain DSM 17290 / CCUG 55495 / CIP 109462 / JCM 13490 / 255-15) TaxID=262543 RepID=B1YLX7_EXIS2|nr:MULTISPECIES: YtzI protein [Exiguobacterium]ACB60460.1 hypothetical protein Exig_0980 [Exiguobacterium sibiricum 255-15]MCT4793839.1 YtzI protein [Exiguobacterium artemiae]MDX1259972.1 YtzI protein [Exiguobacterium sp. K1]HCN59017.1 YtzI protein [Exiguobacterium sp.]
MWLYVVSILIIVFVLVASILVISKGYGYKGNKDDIEIDYDEINRKLSEKHDDEHRP